MHEREMDKTDIPCPLRRSFSEASTFNAGAILGPVNETNMARIWNKHKQFHPVRKNRFSNGANTPLKKKVFVGMSGGVDSSVSAALLEKQGYDVTGVFIKVWQPELEPSRRTVCTWRDDRRDAMRVAAHLGIKFLTVDFEAEYKRDVVDYMIAEYRNGRTPNPDVMCNRSIKFGAFFDWAVARGADYIATGHYARIKHGEGDMFNLLAGVDTNKDQSYFLWMLGHKHLSRTLFPIGKFEKSAVREMARKMQLPTADKKDSQGLCFIGKLDMREFLREFISENEGEVIDENGAVVGTHHGAHLYTIGQRHGFVVIKSGTSERPYYVVDKDTTRNRIVISHDKIRATAEGVATAIVLRDVHWIANVVPEARDKLSARVRYRQPLQTCHILRANDGGVELLFDEPQLAASGQSAVIYRNDECLGGGVIA